MTEAILLAHIFFSISAVASGTAVIILRKAYSLHKILGKFYFYAILLTVFSAFVLMCFPDYTNPMMIFIGFFMLYLALSGYRSLKFKTIFSPDKVKRFDKLISLIMGIISVGMLLYGIYMINSSDLWGIPLIVYGIVGVINVWADFKFFKVPSNEFMWLKYHSSKMIGSYIGSVTAVLVTQFDNALGIYSWFITMVFGLLYMAFWVKKIKDEPSSVFNW
ncbi:hypothetical protein [Ekhidna sp.]